MGNTIEERACKAIEGMDNLIKIVSFGKVDQVMRVKPLESRTLSIEDGPDNEEWETIKRLIYQKAPMEQKAILPVLTGTTKEYTILPESVPVVDLGEIDSDIRFSRQIREKGLTLEQRQLLEKQAVAPVDNRSVLEMTRKEEPANGNKRRGRPKKVLATKEGADG